MAEVLIGIVALLTLGVGALGLLALVEMVKSPYKN